MSQGHGVIHFLLARRQNALLLSAHDVEEVASKERNDGESRSESFHGQKVDKRSIDNGNGGPVYRIAAISCVNRGKLARREISKIRTNLLYLSNTNF